MYSEKLSKYYDILYSHKDYKSECELIKKYSTKNKNLLDVGCGTMTHSIILSEYFKNVTSIDLSKPMIDTGLKKIKSKKINNITALCVDLYKSGFDNEFDNVISMFNVVNHITKLDNLFSFFKTINNSLINDGTFIFDCWNGIACTIDKPKEESIRNSYYDNHALISSTKTTTNLFNSISVMDTNVKIYDDISIIDEFDYSLEQRLWSPNILSELLEMSGFIVTKIMPYFNDEEIAKENDYRLTFVCKKK
jgi:SAM-dependent methyltransferase